MCTACPASTSTIRQNCPDASSRPNIAAIRLASSTYFESSFPEEALELSDFYANLLDSDARKPFIDIFAMANQVNGVKTHNPL